MTDTRKTKLAPLDKAAVLRSLEGQASAREGASRTTGVPEEKIGLANQAHALREALRLLKS